VPRAITFKGGGLRGATTAIQATRKAGEEGLLECVPHLRAFAWFLAKNRDRADDLVQNTIVRTLTAAHQVHAGTNLKAWTFAILRNLHYDEVRKNRVRIQSLDDPLSYEPTMLPSQVASLEFGDFRRAFWQFADDQREALILVGASGLSYDEAAQVCECPKGTIKGRVSRARRELLQILEDGLLADKRRDTPALAGYVGGPLNGRRSTSSAERAQYDGRFHPASLRVDVMMSWWVPHGRRQTAGSSLRFG
jgi:RNA polymerase sigma-70 factor, ECF subfamily